MIEIGRLRRNVNGVAQIKGEYENNIAQLQN
jgi:hypothetical protein